MKPKPNNKEQSAKFIEKAKQIKSDNDKEKFEQAVKKIIKKKS